ncbi:hypothetical protein ACWCQK_38310 [Streptomyces sp. NPDC002306]
MKKALTRRVAPIFLLIQAAYLALLEFAFAFWRQKLGNSTTLSLQELPASSTPLWSAPCSWA